VRGCFALKRQVREWYAIRLTQLPGVPASSNDRSTVPKYDPSQGLNSRALLEELMMNKWRDVSGSMVRRDQSRGGNVLPSPVSTD
jgi:hypothetical protein